MKSRGRAASLGEYSVFFNLEVKDITKVLHLQNYKHITTIFYKEQYFFIMEQTTNLVLISYFYKKPKFLFSCS